jgi:hypothetical protein
MEPFSKAIKTMNNLLAHQSSDSVKPIISGHEPWLKAWPLTPSPAFGRGCAASQASMIGTSEMLVKLQDIYRGEPTLVTTSAAGHQPGWFRPIAQQRVPRFS